MRKHQPDSAPLLPLPCPLPLKGGAVAWVEPKDHERLHEFHWYLKHGYPCRYVPGTGYGMKNYREVFLHHEVLGITNPSRKRPVHHKDEDPLNACCSNLVRCSAKQHRAFHADPNRIMDRGPKRRRWHPCPYKGVSWHQTFGHWTVQLQVDGQNRTIARCASAEEAALVYDAAVLCYRNGQGYLNLLPDAVREQTARSRITDRRDTKQAG